MKKIIFPLLAIILMVSCKKNNENTMFINNQTMLTVIDSLSKNSEFDKSLIEKGVKQTAALWTKEDGNQEEFIEFCKNNYCSTKKDKELLFNRLCDNLETIFGYGNRLTIDLMRPLQVVGYDVLPIDEIFGSYDAFSHFTDDMFANKIAFVVKLNFPFFTLDEKNANAEKWSAQEWGYARLGDIFTDRVPALYQQKVTTALGNAENYIANYNIYMGSLIDEKQDTLFAKDMVLISHWGLRDELKSAYADEKQGLAKQQMIYQVMQRIIDQTIPAEVINNGNVRWNPYSNKIEQNGTFVEGTAEPDARYQYLLDIFKAQKEADPYYATYQTFIERRYNQQYEISMDETEKLFTALVSSPQVKEVAKLIEKRLGRKLQPFDIWYDGFKERSAVSPEKLDNLVKAKYPSKEAFVADLPNLLQKLDFSKEKAQFICSKVSVDASVGAGHAWESKMKRDNSMLRTRVNENGMDYKGYNIGVHEFGHNVEQTISLHFVPNYMLSSVPNTAFTEALAFSFQSRDLELLGLTNKNEESQYMSTLAIFWDCYEIMGVSLLEMKVWKWLYENPNVTASELKEAVIKMSKEIWNQYYAPVFGQKDQTILAIYSHSICDPLYLSAYPIGYLIHYQLEQDFENQKIGPEIERIFSLGKLTPQYWLKKAVGNELSCNALLEATSKATKAISK